MRISNYRIAVLASVTLLLTACAGGPDTRSGSDAPVASVDNRDPIQAPDYAPSTTIADEQPALLAPLRGALENGDWLAATLASPKIDAADLDTLTGSWLRYYHARIRYLRGDIEGTQAELAALRSESLPADLERELLLWQLLQAELRGDDAGAADLALALYRAGGHPQLSQERCEERLWFAVQSADRPAADRPWHSWWSLAEAARKGSGNDAAASLARWLETYPQHPARDRAFILQRAALSDATLIQPALLIPLSGPLARAGEAVTRGVAAAFYANRNGPNDLSMIDSRRYQSIESAYAVARERNADAVIGPLGKLQVAQLLNSGIVELPLLTLNRPDTVVSAAPGSLQLSLAPEDEAQLVARRAFADGGRQALLIRPEGEWGERMETALLETWRGVGGQLRAKAVYGRPSTHSAALQSALNLDASTRRAAELRRLFDEPLESSGQRRRDVDVIFLLVRDADEARSLKPLINYHYAGGLPVYALSTADDGSAAAANRDLDGIRLPVMPWRLGDAPPGIASEGSREAFVSLHAMGADAWNLVQRSQRLASGAGLRHKGYTATFNVAPDGALLRDLPMAEFNRGSLVPR